MQAKFTEARDEINMKILEVLDPEQQMKFHKLTAEQESRKRQRLHMQEEPSAG